jgi:hypothetical protein
MSDANPQSETPPTNVQSRDSQLDQRMALVRKFQAKAAARSDPLAANHGIITGDLMMFAHTLGAAMQEWLTEAKSATAALDQNARAADMYLKFIRQLDRMTRIDSEIATPTEDSSVARGPRPSSTWRE